MAAARLFPVLRLAVRRAAAVQLLTPHLHVSAPAPSSCPKPYFVHTTPSLSQSPSLSLPPKVCPSCSKPLASPIPACTNCWSIFNLSPDVTHHALFGLSYEPNPFAVDLSALKQRFRQAQALCHPDAWTSKGPNKQGVAQALSARVNEAYQALLWPLARAEYILSRNNLPVFEHDKVNDTAFMMEIMESRELIDDAEESDEVIIIMEENDEKINETVHQLEKLVGQKDWVSVKAAAIRLRYLEGIARAAKKWLSNH